MQEIDVCEDVSVLGLGGDAGRDGCEDEEEEEPGAKVGRRWCSCLVLTQEVEIYEVREETRLEELCFDTRESDAEGGAAGD